MECSVFSFVIFKDVHIHLEFNGYNFNHALVLKAKLAYRVFFSFFFFLFQ